MPVVSFHNLTVKVPAIAGPKRFLPAACQGNVPKRTILHNVSGSFPKSGLVAVMGPSGSSKTTLLNAISNRMSFAGSAGMQCYGEVRVDGQVVGPDYFYSKQVSFVPQDTCLFAELTPRESIRFASQMNSPHLSADEIEEQVDAIITALNIQKCADTQIGNEMFRGISGGEAKRVSIGVNIVNSPNILFLDEPTTGLDTETAGMVVRSIQNISLQGKQHDGNGRIIIMTLHQPSSEIWDMIDHIVLMTEGNIVYNGSTKEVVSYFASLGFRMPINTNPADFFLDVVQCQEEHYAPSHNKSSLSYLNMNDIDALPHLLRSSSTSSRGNSGGGSAPGARGETPLAYAEDPRSQQRGSSHSRRKGPQVSSRNHTSSVSSSGGVRLDTSKNTLSNHHQSTHGKEVKAPRHTSRIDRARFLTGAWIHYQKQVMRSEQSRAVGGGDGVSYNHMFNGGGSGHAASLGGSGTAGGTTHDSRAAKRARLREMMGAYYSSLQQQQQQHTQYGVGGDDGFDEEMYALNDEHSEFIEQEYNPSSSALLTTASDTSSNSSSGEGFQQTPIQRFFYELAILTARTWKTFIRTKLMLPLKIVQVVLSAILVICLYTPLTYNQTSALDRSACMYLLIIIQIFATVLGVALVFPQERGVYLNEQASRLYSVLPYFTSKLMVDIPILAVTILGFSLLVFFPVGFQVSLGRFIVFFVVLLGAALTGHGLGLTVAATIPTPELAVLLAPMAIAPFILFSHIALPTGYVLPILRPLQWLSPFWWGTDALMISEFTGLKMECLDDEVYAVPSVVSGLLYICRFEFGEEVLQMYSIDKAMMWPSIIVLYVIAGGTVIFSAIMLKVLSMRVANTVKMEPPVKKGM